MVSIAKQLARTEIIKDLKIATFCLFMWVTTELNAAEVIDADEAFNACMSEAVISANPEQTVAELQALCRVQTRGLIETRFLFEQTASRNPFVLLPHKPNYVLPVSLSTSSANEDPYDDILQGNSLDNNEVKFQISLKFIAAKDVFFNDLDLQFAYTSVSWWQAYNSDISAPFRETNYRPEIIFNYARPWSMGGIEVSNSYVAFAHQSNGQSGLLSRSWNRVIGGLVFENKNIVWSLETWWRFPEDNKEFTLDPGGDDNPDIEKYMGNGELGMLWELPRNNSLEVILRNNLRNENKGAIELGWTFPLSNRLSGYVQYFNGYGEGMVYYNKSTERVGFGIKLTDWL